MRRYQLIFILLIVLTSAPLALAQSEDEDPAEPMRTFILKNPDQVGIACYALDDGENGVYLNADVAFPLASTAKILILTAYAQQVADGELDPQTRVHLETLNRYLLPGTDGGAHNAWLQTVVAEDETVLLDDVVYGMIRFSSNANTDYLLDQLDPERLENLIESLELTNTTIPGSILGLFLALDNHETGVLDPDDITLEELDALQATLAERYVTDADWRAAQGQRRLQAAVPLQQRYFSENGSQGSPLDFARLMEAIYTGAIGDEAAAIARGYLAWPMIDFPLSWADFESVGTKGGSLPGILTAAYYGHPVDGPPVVLAIFYRDLDLMTYFNWIQTFGFQLLELEAMNTACASLAPLVPALADTAETGT
ncbi:MAG: serine hydrolase [Chloroflexota bacterium]